MLLVPNIASSHYGDLIIVQFRFEERLPLIIIKSVMLLMSLKSNLKLK